MDYQKLIKLAQQADKITRNLPDIDKIQQLQHLATKFSYLQDKNIADISATFTGKSTLIANLEVNKPDIYHEFSSIVEPQLDELYSEDETNLDAQASPEMISKMNEAIKEIQRILEKQSADQVSLPLASPTFSIGELIGYFLTIIIFVLGLILKG